MVYVFSRESIARMFLNCIEDAIKNVGYISIADVARMYDGNVIEGEETHGWDNVNGVTITKDSDEKYIIHMPKCKPIDTIISGLPKGEDVMVTKPPHYQSENGLEVIDVIEAFTADLTGMEAVDTGNILKYTCRWKHKNGVQDLKKARWYLDHLIDYIEANNFTEERKDKHE